MILNWFASIAPGLEPVLVQELASYDVTGQSETGGVSFTAHWNKMQQIAPYLRTPTTLRLQLLCNEPIKKLSDLRILLNGINWKELLPEGTQVKVKASCRKSRLQRSDIIEDKSRRILRAILNSAGGPTLQFTIRIFQDRLWLSAQMHDDLLHKRGWRTQQVRAPLRENWAAALLEIANWEADEPLLDPFCGSGTILIEAARRALHLPIHLHSPFTWRFWKLPSSEPELHFVNHTLELHGSDRDGTSINKAKQNAALALTSIQFKTCDIQHRKAPAKEGLIVTNPPYGMSSGKRTDAIYHWFGEVLREELSNWRVLFLAPNTHKANLVSPKVECLTQFSNGGIRVGVYALPPYSSL